MKQGWTISQIDEMDILFYFWLLNQSSAKKQKVTPIDQVGFL
ncbi:hypothetical protein [Brevibacillus agri]